jgi:hypothetical protein
LVSGTSSTLTVNEPLVIDDTAFLEDVLTIENNGRFVANANVTVTSGGFSSANAIVRSGGILELQSGTFSVGRLSLSGATAFQRTSGSYQARALTLENGASVSYRAGDQLVSSAGMGTYVNLSTGATLTLEQNLSAGFVNLAGTGSSLARTTETVAIDELSVSGGANLSLIAGDVVSALSVGNFEPDPTGSSTVNLAPETTTLSVAGLWLWHNGSIPQLASIPYEIGSYLSLRGGQSLTYRSGNGIEDTIQGSVGIDDNATLTLQKNLTLTGESAGIQLGSGGSIVRNGFTVSAPTLALYDGGSLTLGDGFTITDGVSVGVYDAAASATLTLAENLVLTGETAQYDRGLSLSGIGATLVRGEGITITATAADTALRVSRSADFTVRAGDDFTGASIEAYSGGKITIASEQSVARVYVYSSDPEQADSPSIVTVDAPLTITDTAPRALAVEDGGRFEANADVTVGDVVVESFSDISVLSLMSGTLTADTVTVTNSFVERSGGLYDIGTLSVQGASMDFRAGDSLGSLSLSDTAAPAAFSTTTAPALEALSIFGTSVLTLGAFDGSDAFVADYGLRLVGDQATNLTALVTAGRIVAPGFGELDIAYVAGADATYITVVPEPVVTGLAAIGLAVAAAVRRRLCGRPGSRAREPGNE